MRDLLRRLDDFMSEYEHNYIPDVIAIVFLLIFIGVTWFFRSEIPNAYKIIGFYFSLIAFILGIMALSLHYEHSGLVKIIHIFYFFIVLLASFSSLGFSIPYFSSYKDVYLIEIDRWIFGEHPAVLLNRYLYPFLIEISKWAYSMFYFLPVGIAVILIRHKKFDVLNLGITAIVLTFYINYIGYMLVPAMGPRFTLVEGTGHTIYPVLKNNLNGIFAFKFLYDLIYNMELNKVDCFPSGHTAITLIVLYMAYRYERKAFPVFLIIGGLLIFATVYIRYHYVIDLISAIPLAFFGYFIALKIHEKNYVFERYLKRIAEKLKSLAW